MLLIVMILFASLAYANERIEVELVRVVDGDTIIVNISGWPDIVGYEIGVRVAGCDTPELRDKRYDIKAKAYQAKETLTLLLSTARCVELRNIERGKYFRLVADVIADGANVASILIDSGLAHPYDGGKRPAW